MTDETRQPPTEADALQKSGACSAFAEVVKMADLVFAAAISPDDPVDIQMRLAVRRFADRFRLDGTADGDGWAARKFLQSLTGETGK